MLSKRLDSVLGTGRRETAMRAQHRADRILVNFDEVYQEPRHRLDLCSSRSNSSRTKQTLVLSKGFMMRTIISSASSSCWFVRNTSRTVRLARLRATAVRNSLFPTTIPKRARIRKLGLAWTRRKAPFCPQRKLKTDEYSSVFSNRDCRGKHWSCPSVTLPLQTLACASGGETGTTFGAAGTDHRAAAFGSHAYQKAMSAFAANNGRLISALHDKPQENDSVKHIIRLFYGVVCQPEIISPACG